MNISFIEVYKESFFQHFHVLKAFVNKFIDSQ
jgi:hypothetical protein